MSTASYDYARFIAAVGIVVFHAGSFGATIGYAALPFFLMLIIYNGWKSAASADFLRYINGRAERLLKPWLAWSAVYGVLKLVEVAVADTTLSDEFAPYMLLTGPAIHLWFLPFAFAICLLLWPLTRMGAMPVGVVAFCVALVLQGYIQEQNLPIPLAQWAHVAPAVCLGFSLAAISRRVAIVCAFTGLSFVFGWTAGLLQTTLAALSIIACGWIIVPRTPISKKLAAASMGIYLVHPLVFSVFQRTVPLEKNSLASAILVATVSLCIALTLIHMKMLLSPKATSPN
ncbi:acyltransferase family protein [Falsihalocynthiibacter arcticus]|uniref:Acyltransferase 3 domain-containing protein n=1 Tax=Falsihalocynthiibacter arcticus TaxID=1579316 RepID=A0A126V5Y9_9RHOB|nr:acyltransferase family protein [Falsihalocynthiibacter arcticus]AML53375.1 hypothetical protein RC74_20840 [Falsihalocynthiibacter arcticus]